MVAISVNIAGTDEVVKKITQFTLERQVAIQQALNIAAINIEREAKQLAPVDMGRLRSSLRIRFFQNAKAMGYDVFTDVFYAIYQELGTGIYARNGNGRQTPWVYTDPKTGQRIFTRGNHPHPFLYPAWDMERPKLIKRLNKALKTGGTS
jgi:HK97 gp10 family phage protein